MLLSAFYCELPLKRHSQEPLAFSLFSQPSCGRKSVQIASYALTNCDGSFFLEHSICLVTCNRSNGRSLAIYDRVSQRLNSSVENVGGQFNGKQWGRNIQHQFITAKLENMHSLLDDGLAYLSCTCYQQDNEARVVNRSTRGVH